MEKKNKDVKAVAKFADVKINFRVITKNITDLFSVVKA